MTRRNAQEQKLADAQRLLRAWNAFHREERDAVLAGPHARTLAELFRMFVNLPHVTPAQLIGFVGAVDWAVIDYQTRLTVLHEVNSAITKFREQRGLEPIDNPLQGEPLNAFQRIRVIMFPASAGEPTSGNG